MRVYSVKTSFPIPRFYEDKFHEDKFWQVFLPLLYPLLAKEGKERGRLVATALRYVKWGLHNLCLITIISDLNL